ncbi:MAG TPA: methyltransferase [Vicinamibacterales bacterium]|nr:methyltransferase [Vicinamibacterales bacterium]
MENTPVPGTKTRLTTHDLWRFPSESLFDRLGRAVCAAGCLPRKELYEAWEVARRTRRRFRGGRVLDCGGGHGLLAHVMLLLDDSSPSAVVVDKVIPPSSASVSAAVLSAWPRLRDRVTYLASDLAAIAIDATDVVVSSHACGGLTDVILARAADARARVAVLPCCHDLTRNDAGDLSGWLDGALAIDVMRAVRLKERGYEVWTQTIPAAITPKNRLLLARPTAP